MRYGTVFAYQAYYYPDAFFQTAIKEHRLPQSFLRSSTRKRTLLRPHKKQQEQPRQREHYSSEMLLTRFFPLFLFSTFTLAAPAPNPKANPAPIPVPLPQESGGLLEDLPVIIDGIKELLTPDAINELKDILKSAHSLLTPDFVNQTTTLINDATPVSYLK